MDKKMTIVVLFGGQSSEHEVSCVSVQTIIKALDPEKYDPVLVGITKEGRWLLAGSLEDIVSGAWKESGVSAVLSPDATEKCLLLLDGEQVRKVKVDVIFPVLHGKYGEDGTIQGLFELAQIPYVGCGVLASAVSMDKAYTKVIVNQLNIRQAKYVVVTHLDLEDMARCAERVEAELAYPVFVKPSKAGSSCGVSKACDREQLETALKEAILFDNRVLVEETILGREIECAVLGGYEPKASNVGEVLAAETFYTYDAKYNNPDSKTELHPEFPDGKMEEVRKDAVEIFRAVDGFGLARVDFFLEKDTSEVVFNEINTLPGFTAISMYPMLWEDRGLPKNKLVDRLIELAFARRQ
ncbi:MAG: D-alanine--D-alanine ligase family protein [Lachnospiraceae bacterium]|nr:D-alanine--D-alanine ligase family protein [Lachnospiraceae bacterium]